MQQNTYSSPTAFVNPANPLNIVVPFGKDSVADSSESYFPTGIEGQVAYTNDGGLTWAISTPSATSCLGGTLSQNPLPSEPYGFSFSGCYIFFGLFNDVQPFGDRFSTKSGIYVQTSNDGGATWSNAVILDTSDSGSFTGPTDVGGFVGGQGYTVSAGGSILADPNNNCLVHVMETKILDPETIYGNLWYYRSENGGKSFSAGSLVYDMTRDPVWLAKYSNPALFPLGGESFGGTLVSVPNRSKHGCKQTLLAGFLRIYPKIGSTTYTQSPVDSNFDHAVIFSHDNGKSWSQSAVQVQPYNLGISHSPATTPTIGVPVIVFDGSINNYLTVSPKNRVYFVYQAANPRPINADPRLNLYYPVIQLNVSADAGQTWSANQVVSNTPYNPAAPESNQAFNPNIVVLPNGYVGIIYEDYRNSTPTTFACDVWLDIYQELDNPTGGPAGNGLSGLVKEIHLAGPFDPTIGFASPSVAGVGGATGIAALGTQFFTSFAQTVQGSLPLGTGPLGSAVDPNNRLSVFVETVTP